MRKISQETPVLVVMPVRIKDSGEYLESNPIVTESKDEENALKQAKNYSGLSRFKEWSFLIYGTLTRGKISKEKNYEKQIENISRKRFNSPTRSIQRSSVKKTRMEI